MTNTSNYRIFKSTSAKHIILIHCFVQTEITFQKGNVIYFNMRLKSLIFLYLWNGNNSYKKDVESGRYFYTIEIIPGGT